MKNMLIILLFLFSSIHILGKEKVTLVTFPIPRYVESSEKGEFVHLAKELAKKLGYELELNVFPPKRSLNVFLDGKVDGYFPALDRLKVTNFYKTSNFYIKKNFIFQLKNSDYRKLKRPKVCLTRGYSYGRDVQESKKWKVYYAKSDIQCLNLLRVGRVQLFIGEETTTLAALNSVKLLDKVHYDKNSPITIENVYFAFSETEKGRVLSQKFDKLLKKMNRTGELKSILRGKER